MGKFGNMNKWKIETWKNWKHAQNGHLKHEKMKQFGTPYGTLWYLMVP